MFLHVSVCSQGFLPTLQEGYASRGSAWGGGLPLGGSRKAGGTGMLSSYYYAVFTLTYSESETDN